MTPDTGAQPGQMSPVDGSGPRELLRYRSAQGRFPDLTPAPLGGRTSSEIVAGLVPGALLVKAASHLRPSSSARIRLLPGGQRVIFVSGDSSPAKQAIIDLFNGAGFHPIDLGDLVSGGRMQRFGGPPRRAQPPTGRDLTSRLNHPSVCALDRQVTL